MNISVDDVIDCGR